MGKNIETLVKEFNAYVAEMKYYQQASGVLGWDLRTGAPKKAINERSKVLSMLAGKSFEMSTSDKMGDFIKALDDADGVDAITKASVKECKRNYDKSKKIPKDRFKEYILLKSKSESVWEEAREKNDFEMFRPYLEKVVEFQKEFVEYLGYEGNKYNTLLDNYEIGMTVDKVDELFGELKKNLVPLVKAINESGYEPKKFFDNEFDVAKQKEFCKYILKEMNYDFDAGRLDESVHPFTIGITPGDVRVTTRFSPTNFEGALFGTIHEGGHALYEQNVSPELIGTVLCRGTSSGIHESQSRFWENIVGRSKAFWSRYLGELAKYFPEQAKGFTLDDFYRGTNKVNASMIRVEADECTYNLHIMLRYELEKQLINGEIEVKDLPSLWNDKMEEYLGIRPKTDSEGVLQDMHWSGGMFGYFPTYALGNLYSAQIYNAIKKEIPDFNELVAKGDFEKIFGYLKENIYRHGKLLKPNEIIKNISGEELSGKYLAAYLEEKYKDIYNI